MQFPCTVKGIMDDAYGKYGKDAIDSQVLMEFDQMFPYINDYLPANLK